MKHNSDNLVLALRLIASLWLACLSAVALAEPISGLEESKVKMALIYNFGQFIEWPPSAFAGENAKFSICVMGRNPFGDAILSLEKHAIKGRPIMVKYPESLADAQNCNILYVADPRSTILGNDVGKALGNAPVLTVSDDADAVGHGIAIGFLNKGGKIRWALNLDETRRAQLKVSSKLVEIAVMLIGAEK